MKDSIADAQADMSNVSVSYFRRLYIFLLRLAWITVLSTVVAVFALRFAVLPHLNHVRPWIEQRVSRALGAQVSIGALSGRWRWRALTPEIEISRLSLHDSSGRSGISFPYARATLSWRTVWTFKPIFKTVSIDAPVIAARRAANGQIWIAGIPLDTQARGESAFITALLNQRVVRVHHGTVQWRDEARALPPLVLNDLQLTLFNNGHRHRLDVQANRGADTRAKSAGSGSLKLHARFRHRRFSSAADPAHWKGQFEFAAHALDLAAIGRSVDLPVRIEQGWLNGRVQVRFNAMQIRSVRGELAGKALRARFKPDLPEFTLPSLAFLYRIARVKSAFSIQLSHLSIAMLQRQFATDHLNIDYRPPSPKQAEYIALEGDSADLGLVAELTPALPVARAFTAALVRFKPRGMLRDYTFEWTRDANNLMGQSKASPRYRISAQFTNASIAAQRPDRTAPSQPGWPGFDHLSER